MHMIFLQAFGKACPSNTNIIEFTDELKQLVLDTHNSYRNEIACGEVDGYDKAARMATLVWHDELAKFAEYNVRRCIFGHDKCRNTEKFLYAGQNLGKSKNNKEFEMAEDIIKTLHVGWFGEKKDANMTIIKKYNKTEKKIGHFTQLVRDQAYAVGCALVQFEKDGWFTSIFGCDYSLTNILNKSIYAPVNSDSTNSASKCKTGTNPEFKCLCSANEVYTNKLYYKN
ncbi:antigen 5 like allergen Cul n 1-like [Contarinia nasturtii]|uniref:antigen 5 like allergen Cul n 1-like n=1 Tax=Contarinia nasturtii TaxID=265458 RepID=UPI0012D47335|nr:antigen 5 like allergen Cul n 1-like [Contarinia nasturtii]